MRRSIFAPSGQWKHKGGEPLAKRLHRTAMQLFGAEKGHFSAERGSTVDLFSFTLAIMVARAADKIERAGGERYARTVYALLPEQEGEHGLVPDPDATIPERKRALEARKVLPRGCGRGELLDGLERLLGDNFVGIHVPNAAANEVSIWPAALGDAPMLLQPADVDRKLIRLLSPICIGLGAPQWVSYHAVDPGAPTDLTLPNTLRKDDRILIEPEIHGRAEPVTVLAIGNTGSVPKFQAVFNNAHEPLCFATTNPFPLWISTQREMVVIVTNKAIIRPATRAQIHDHLSRVLTGVTTWALVQESSPGSGVAGPFTTDDPVLGMLDANPLETCTATL
jgi:hypothetical protein